MTSEAKTESTSAVDMNASANIKVTIIEDERDIRECLSFLINGTDTGGRLTLIEHRLPPRSLAAPLHTHTREDEFSWVLATMSKILVDLLS